MNHNHHNHCLHSQLAYCAICDVAYCKTCGKEWKNWNVTWTYNPSTWSSGTVKSGDSSWTISTDNVTGHTHAG